MAKVRPLTNGRLISSALKAPNPIDIIAKRYPHIPKAQLEISLGLHLRSLKKTIQQSNAQLGKLKGTAARKLHRDLIAQQRAHEIAEAGFALGSLHQTYKRPKNR